LYRASELRSGTWRSTNRRSRDRILKAAINAALYNRLAVSR
jgi:hypothetical protein